MRINSIPLEKGTISAGVCLKKHTTLENTGSLKWASWNNDGRQYALNRNIIKYIVYMQFMVASALLRNTVSISIEE